MTARQNQLQQLLRTLALETINRVGDYDRAKGFLRYEKMRTLNLKELGDLTARSKKGESWDDMIDELLVGDLP